MPSSRALTPSSGSGHLLHPRQPYQSTPYQHAYQATADDEEVENKPPSKEVLEVLYEGQELDKDGRYHTDQTDNKVFVGFLRIKSLYQRCRQGFPSRSVLHKHFKAECVPVKDLINAASPVQLSFSILILQSKSTFEASSSGFAFRS